MMNTDYIIKIEKLNEESRLKIEQLKKLLTEANEEKVDALNQLNDIHRVLDALRLQSPRRLDLTVRGDAALGHAARVTTKDTPPSGPFERY